MIHYFDANLVNDSGEGFLIKNAICMHEEDAGVGWKHTGLVARCVRSLDVYC